MKSNPIIMKPASVQSPPIASSADFDSLQQAAEWYALLGSEEVSTLERERWQAWFNSATQHQQAWHQVERISQRFAPLHNCSEPALAVLQQTGKTPLSRRKLLSTSLSLMGIGVLGWGTWRYSALSSSLDYWQADERTATGEIRTLVLADGTRLSLNTNSAANIDYSVNARHVRLVQGEIFIATAPDSRPFQVLTNEGRLVPLGTQFSVQQQDQLTRLNVYEGAVQLTNQSGASQIVNAGQQVAFSASSVAAPTKSDAKRNWVRGLLMAEDINLAQLIAELTPFHHRFINLSPEVAHLRVMGTYPLTDLDETLAMLENSLPIRIERRLHWWISISPK